MIGSAPKCPATGKRSNTVFIIQITCASILITFIGASLTLIFGKPEDASNYLDFAGQVVLWLGAAGGVSAPAKKLGDAWHDRGRVQPPSTSAPSPTVSNTPTPPTPTAETPTEPERQCSNCGTLNPGDPCSNCEARQS